MVTYSHMKMNTRWASAHMVTAEAHMYVYMYTDAELPTAEALYRTSVGRGPGLG